MVDTPIRLRRAQTSDRAEWSAFLARSDNGTLFHDLDFLGYHPPDRFETHHLIAGADEIEFLLPAGLVRRGDKVMLVSPVGASVGGPVFARRVTAARAVAAIESLQEYARVNGINEIALTLPPTLYNAAPSDDLAFALYNQGFCLRARWLTHLVNLSGGEERYRKLYRSRMASFVRAKRREGVEVIEGGAELLSLFTRVFADTYARHGVAATHTVDEIACLLSGFPDRVRIFLAMLDGEPTAGLLVMFLNRRVACSFYICMSAKHADAHGNLVVFAFLLDRLGAAGVQWLDLGPSARPGNINTGVTFFKEGIGGIGHCRDRWEWRSDVLPEREAIE